MNNISDRKYTLILIFLVTLLASFFTLNYIYANRSFGSIFRNSDFDSVEIQKDTSYENIKATMEQIGSISTSSTATTSQTTKYYYPADRSFGLLVQTKCKNGVCETVRKELEDSEMREMNKKIASYNEQMRRDIESRIFGF